MGCCWKVFLLKSLTALVLLFTGTSKPPQVRRESLGESQSVSFTFSFLCCSDDCGCVGPFNSDCNCACGYEVRKASAPVSASSGNVTFLGCSPDTAGLYTVEILPTNTSLADFNVYYSGDKYTTSGFKTKWSCSDPGCPQEVYQTSSFSIEGDSWNEGICFSVT